MKAEIRFGHPIERPQNGEVSTLEQAYFPESTLDEGGPATLRARYNRAAGTTVKYQEPGEQ